MIELKINRLSAFLGRPVPFNGVNIYSPSIEEIERIGELEYRVNLILATFDKEKIVMNLLGVSEEAYMQLSGVDDYVVLVSEQRIAQYIAKALSFFIKEEVIYQEHQQSFCLGELNFLHSGNYKDFIAIIRQLNGTEEEEAPALTFKSERAKLMLQKINKLKNSAKGKNNDYLELKDILSILCCVEGNAISIFNVGQLTVYQVYEQFERLSIKHRRDTLLPVWANGYLQEGEKLPEIIAKTKL
ncbi:hypothetical protein K0T92_04890 [Paenibacillus oenotherae]|uniref:Uncharacterized protein n=1 Tax=Paenibacillus oenotherae TaxID=1435645 RepID=A0ABS7D2J4_9BACL|nr:hypothetical protein [Paenibacillus oenotherae]MBW7474069.1 hypothetical protein [Paenibacillus oenotherae]